MERIIRSPRDLMSEIKTAVKNGPMKAKVVADMTGLSLPFISRTLNLNQDFRVTTVLKIINCLGYELVLRKKV